MELIPSFYNIFQACWIIAGMYVDAKLFWMIVYEVKYGKGEEYLTGDFKKCHIKTNKNERSI